MEKGLLFVPNSMLVLYKIIGSTFNTGVRLETKTVARLDNMFESDKVNLLAYAAKEEVIDLVERPGTKVAIGLTKPIKPRRIELGMQNKNMLV